MFNARIIFSLEPEEDLSNRLFEFLQHIVPKSKKILLGYELFDVDTAEEMVGVMQFQYALKKKAYLCGMLMGILLNLMIFLILQKKCHGLLASYFLRSE